jgi:pimeloyl-ACP methyl ester carboxylesterase
MAADLVRDHTVIVPDLRGLGLSSKPSGGFDKKTQAHDVAGVLDDLKTDRTALVTHDIGNMVGYAFAAQYPARVTRFALIDAPVPGIGPWEEVLKNPLLWHFRPKNSLARLTSFVISSTWTNGLAILTSIACFAVIKGTHKAE